MADRVEEHWNDDRKGVEFRYFGDELDEIVACNVDIHLECMGTGSWWMSITHPDGRQFMVNLGVIRARSAGEELDLKWLQKNLTNWVHHELDD